MIVGDARRPRPRSPRSASPDARSRASTSAASAGADGSAPLDRPPRQPDVRSTTAAATRCVELGGASVVVLEFAEPLVPPRRGTPSPRPGRRRTCVGGRPAAVAERGSRRGAPACSSIVSVTRSQLGDDVDRARRSTRQPLDQVCERWSASRAPPTLLRCDRRRPHRLAALRAQPHRPRDAPRRRRAAPPRLPAADPRLIVDDARRVEFADLEAEQVDLARHAPFCRRRASPTRRRVRSTSSGCPQRREIDRTELVERSPLCGGRQQTLVGVLAVQVDDVAGRSRRAMPTVAGRPLTYARERPSPERPG